MLTIEEYIAKMKRANKLDEFDYVKISENMSSVMKYVMSYFNEYLTMETCDVEEIKHRHAADKLEQEAAERFPNSKSFVVEFYLSNKIRIDKLVDNWMKKLQYLELYYSEDDFACLADEYCSSTNIAGVDMQVYKDSIKILMAEIKAHNTDKLDFSDIIHLDNNIVSWIKDTYHTYGVNLIEFASNTTYSFYERYVKYERERFSDRGYYINNYNHRYNENPFDIDRIYEQNKHKPFLENKRGELEMLMMYEWLFNDILDEEYWPEYVNLCVAQHRVNIVKSVNVLIPVTIAGLKYPEDAPSTTDIIITSDGIIKKPPTGSYVLRLELIESQTNVWQDLGEMSTLIALLEKNFKEYGLPELLELSAPMKTASFDEEVFFTSCSLLEKKMKKHSRMKVAIINGPTNKRTKGIVGFFYRNCVTRSRRKLGLGDAFVYRHSDPPYA